MVKKPRKELHVGDRVLIPWGVDEVRGIVIEIWGSPPAHVRVALDAEEGEESEVLLLNPSVVKRVA
jgi:primosomal protein N'